MFTIHGVYLYPVKHPQIHIWTLWFLFRASRAAADKCWLRLSLSCGCRFVPCCVESTAEALSLQVIISTLGCVLRDEPNTFSRLALRPPGWPTCGDVNTHSSVSQKDAIRSVLTHFYKEYNAVQIVSDIQPETQVNYSIYVNCRVFSVHPGPTRRVHQATRGSREKHQDCRGQDCREGPEDHGTGASTGLYEQGKAHLDKTKVKLSAL